MACSSTQKIRFQLRRALESEWVSSNPTLLPGEPAISTDSKQIKIGTGALWSETDYINLGGGIGSVGTPTTIATLLMFTGSSKSGTTINLSSQATLPQNQAVAFKAPITASDGGGDIVANRPYYVFASITDSNSVQVKTSIGATTAY